MKKILLIVAIAGTVLAGCSKSGAGSKMRVILASELISLDEAKNLLGNNSTVNNGTDRSGYHDRIMYRLPGSYYFGLSLWQEALYNKSDWRSYLQEMENVWKTHPRKTKSTINGGTAYHIPFNPAATGAELAGKSFQQHMMYIFYGDYYIILDIQNTTPDLTDNPTETAKKISILNNAANVALTNLKRILDNN